MLTQQTIDDWQKLMSKHKILPENKKSKELIKKELAGLIANAVAKRVPNTKIGVLFSGGIDSVLIAKILQDLRVDFTCYTAALTEPNLKVSEDLIWAKKAANQLGFKLKINTITLKDVPKHIKKIIQTIDDASVVKVGVALPLYLACETAKKDGVKTVFSGLGSEEIFAGYERHDKSKNINKECLTGLKTMDERDLKRDFAITKAHNQCVSAPLLDEELIDYALKIPSKYKIVREHKKVILREVAQETFQIPKALAWRPKRAAQYGSGFDKAITKLAKKNGFKYKADYLNSFLPKQKYGALFSSGKDSTYALYLAQQKYDVNCLITIKSSNPDSYMFHTPNINLTSLQAKALGIPLIEQKTSGKKESELKDLKTVLQRAKKEYQLEGIITGALFSNYQRERIEKIASELNLKVYSPLWHKDQATEMREVINTGFKIIFSSIAAYGLDKSWLGRVITLEDVTKLEELNKKIGINIAGEGGEFESLVLNGPNFKKELSIKESEIIEEDENTAKLIVKKAVLR
ncbi:diphthine--ammonia ligase [Candidatus Woesearchaeota archaeon]|nr:diphthine--ammonia ligase [Candidatus Woesearchaeota archaeon]